MTRVQGRADLVAHVRQEGALGAAGGFGGLPGLFQLGIGPRQLRGPQPDRLLGAVAFRLFPVQQHGAGPDHERQDDEDQDHEDRKGEGRIVPAELLPRGDQPAQQDGNADHGQHDAADEDSAGALADDPGHEAAVRPQAKDSHGKNQERQGRMERHGDVELEAGESSHAIQVPHDGQQCDQRHQQRETLGRPQAAADFHVHGQEGQARQDETDRRGRRNAVGVHGIGAEVAAKEDLVDAQSPAEEHVAELDESHQGDEGGDHLGKDPQASIVHGLP